MNEYQPLDSYLAVFNRHASDHRRGRLAVNAKFGKGSYRKYVSPYERKGMMSIFGSKPNAYTTLYVQAVTSSVNARRERGH